jgi:hypothetical protein
MSDHDRDRLKVVSDEPLSVKKPDEFDFDAFRSTHDPSIANVATLLTALPHYRIADAKDFVRLHPNETTHWSPELCFVNVPIKGQKQDTLHLITEQLAELYLPSNRIERFRLALATKPHDVPFLCRQRAPQEQTRKNVFHFFLVFCFEIRRLFADERRTAVPAPSSLACSRNEMSPPGWATSSHGNPRSWLIGAGISGDRPPHGTPYPCSPLTPPPNDRSHAPPKWSAKWWPTQATANDCGWTTAGTNAGSSAP